MTPVVSSGLMMGPFESALRSARALDAKIIRYGLTTVLCGDRHALGDKWKELVADVRAALADRGPRALRRRPDAGDRKPSGFRQRGAGRTFARRRAASASASTPATPFPVAEAPLDFTRRVAPHVRHVHLKDYRVQFTDEGYRLVRCAIGDGAVPFAAMLDEPRRSIGQKLTAVLEPGALEARHVRFLRPEWWNGYPPKSGDALRRLPRRGAGQPPRRRRRLSHALGARRGRRDRRLRTGDDPPQRRQHARDRPWTRTKETDA